MATATNPTPTSALHPLRNTNTDSGAASLGSPRRSPAARGAWTQIVRGGESESLIAATSSSPLSPSSSSEQIVNSSNDRSPSKVAGNTSSFSPEDAVVEAQVDSSDNSSNAAKKPVWNKPSNGAVEVASPVMGAVSWPALSESTKASPKADLLKALPEGSDALSQGTGMTFPPSQKQVNPKNVNTNSTPNHAPTRQRSIKRGGGNQSNYPSSNGGFPQQQPLQGSVVEITQNNSGKSGNSGAESTLRVNNHRDGGQRGGFGSQSPGGNEHQQHRSSYRRGNGGPHPRGDGSYHHGYGGRRDQERGNQDWNPNRSFGSRDANMQPQRGPTGPFFRGPPHASPHFMPQPLPVRPPFGAPMVYPEVPPPVIYVPGLPTDPLRMPMIAPMPPMFFHVPDTQLYSKIVSQIDYYFSNENLIKDTFLRQNMDEQGWVPVNLIAGFKKVMQLTDNLQLMLDAVRSSTVVEVQGEKIRRRNDWMNWAMPPSVQYSTVSSPLSHKKSSTDSLAEHFQSVVFDEKTEQFTYHSRSSSAELSSSSKQSDNEIGEQAVAQRGRPMPFGNPTN
ncbi:la-related protein 1C [Lycium ferocissimum]|uniref:la-related protein 1C n=1 Tax=Lycium ferocissimum TaxID=112874 RepID=UPI0028155B0D|nr:la-related protein 1C [Lycium ferocissimum]